MIIVNVLHMSKWIVLKQKLRKYPKFYLKDPKIIKSRAGKDEPKPRAPELLFEQNENNSLSTDALRVNEPSQQPHAILLRAFEKKRMFFHKWLDAWFTDFALPSHLLLKFAFKNKFIWNCREMFKVTFSHLLTSKISKYSRRVLCIITLRHI